MPTLPQTVSSLRGGLNEDPPISLQDDQCVVARNIEWVTSPVGERRRGAAGVNLTGSPLATCTEVVFLYRHLPTTNLADAQLWGAGLDGAGGLVLAYKDTSWHLVVPADPFVVNGLDEYLIQAQTLHGKLFLAYHSPVDRLHVWDGTSLRRTGLVGVTTPPTVAETGTGTVAGVRSYRVRFTRHDGLGATVVRSEPSAEVAFTPAGTALTVVVTRPPGPGEGETHWEAEGSLDGSNWYRFATQPLATLTADDTTTPTDTYLVRGYPLAEDVGDYSLIPSVRYLAVDEDRLMGGGSFMDPSINSRICWTPVHNAVGSGNDERLALDTTPFLDLDNFEGGHLSGLSNDVNGYLFATKFHHIYQLARTGVRTRAYEAIPLTKQRGALMGSLVEGFNQAGQPFLFALDPDIGPIHIGGPNGIEPCGADLVKTWETVNLDAKVAARAIYFPEKRQVHWWVATGVSDWPNQRLVLHTNLMRSSAEGARGGFAKWSGLSSEALAVTMFADNIDAGGPRSKFLKPFIGLRGNGLIWRTDTGDDDHGAAYSAQLRTKPFARSGLLDRFEVGEGELMAAAAAGVLLNVAVIGLRSDHSLVTRTVSGIDLTPDPQEGDAVIRGLDNLGLAEVQTVQIDVSDHEPNPGPLWRLDLLSITLTGGQRARL
jgi:hypothetical protein